MQVLVQQGLVAGGPRAELLQELVGVAQDLHHLGVALDVESRGEGAQARPGVEVGQGSALGPQSGQVQGGSGDRDVGGTEGQSLR